jgi:hypothetical protein
MTTSTTLMAFHGSQAVKDKYVARVQRHAELDEIIQGTYWQNGKGCAIGCALHSGEHSRYEIELGLPTWLAYLEEGLFERMPETNAKTFPLRFLQAIPVGAELTQVRDKFQLWLLIDPEFGSINHTRVGSEQYNAVKQVAKLLEQAVNGHEPTECDWSAAESAAESAARSAAESAAGSAAWSAAESAARSAAGSAAWSAAGSAAWSAAESAANIRMADKLIELLAEAKPFVLSLPLPGIISNTEIKLPRKVKELSLA